MEHKDQIAGTREGFLSRLQQAVGKGRCRIAGLISDRFNRYSAKKQKLFLLLFTLLCAFGSGLVAWNAFVKQSTQVVRVDAIRVPAVPKTPRRLPVFSDKEYQRLHAYRLHLDSLAALGDSSRRRLRDTLLYLEAIYQQQLNRKRDEKQ